MRRITVVCALLCLTLTSCVMGVVKKEVFVVENSVSATPTPTPLDVNAAQSDSATKTTTPSPTATATQTPTPTVEPTATRSPSNTNTSPRLAIDHFTVEASNLSNGGKRVTFHWQTTSATRVMLHSGTRPQYVIWWDNLNPDGELTHDFDQTFFADPQMTLMAYNAKRESVSAYQTVSWPCEHSYYFTPAPSTCAHAPATVTDGAYQQFENGWMLWMRELALGNETLEGVIFVFYDNGWFERYDDTWLEGQPINDPLVEAPNGFQQPVRGFGKVWRENTQVRERLGWATDQEHGYPIQWQPEMHASIPYVAYIQHRDGRIIRTYYSWTSGSWQVWRQ